VDSGIPADCHVLAQPSRGRTAGITKREEGACRPWGDGVNWPRRSG
jgi:hypothetical protein